MLAWWDSFGDPVLTELQRLAEANSPTLDQAVARILQARATLSASKAQALPTVNASGSYTQSEQKLRTGGQGLTVSNEGFQYGADASWQIDLFGKVHRSNEAGRARIEARVDDYHAARISLAAEVADIYVQHRGCAQLAKLYRQQAQSQGETARLTRINADAGFTAPAEAALADAAAASMRSALADQVAQCDLLAKSLTSLTGKDETGLRAMLAEGGGLPRPANLTVASVPADLVRKRPDIASIERELAAASAEIGVAAADLYPSLSLGGSISTGGGTSMWSFGPSISLPLFDGGKARAGVRQARATYDLQFATYREIVRAAILEVEQALVRLDAARDREADAARSAEGYAKNFTAIERLREAGSSTMIERESARRNALDAERALVDLRISQVRYWIALYKALGGGWDVATSKAPDTTFKTDPNSAGAR